MLVHNSVYHMLAYSSIYYVLVYEYNDVIRCDDHSLIFKDSKSLEFNDVIR